MSNRRTQPVQTPGVEQPEASTDAAAAGATTDETAAAEGDGSDPLPPDVQRVIDQRVDQRLAAIKQAERRAKSNPATGRDDLPTQEEALAKVQADSKRRAVLSRDGWVTATPPVKDRDDNGFAKA